MWKYIIRRAILTLPVLLIVSIITFSIMQLAPGDPAAIVLGGDYIMYATAQEIEDVREAMGINKPPITQYFNWLGGFFVGNLGTSLFTTESVSYLVSQKIEATVSTVFSGIFIAILLGIPMGVLAGWKMNTWIDRAVMVFAVLGFAIPGFWLAFNLIFLFSLKLDQISTSIK